MMSIVQCCLIFLYLGLFYLGEAKEYPSNTKDDIIRYKVQVENEDLKGFNCTRLYPRPLESIPLQLDFRKDICTAERQVGTCSKPLETCYHDISLNISISSLDEYTITFSFIFECLKDKLMQVFEWWDVVADIQCTIGHGSTLKLTSQSTYYTLHLQQAKGYIHLILQYTGASKFVNAVFVNKEKLKGQTHLRNDFPQRINFTDHEQAIRIGLKSINGEAQTNHYTFYGTFGAINLFGSLLDEREMELEYQHSHLLARKVLDPECLCQEGLPIETNDTCPDGSRRLGDLHRVHSQVMAINDGSWDPTHSTGYNLPSLGYVWLHLQLYEPSIIKQLKLYMGTDLPGIEAYRGIDVSNQRVVLFCHNTDTCQRNEEVAIKESGYKEVKCLVWRAKEIFITRVLHLLFTNATHPTDIVFEIILRGRPLHPPFLERRCLCFPGNGRVDKECKRCGHCLCRNGNTTLAGKSCEPYLTSINPSYGPRSGGTYVTIHGGLLLPDVYQDMEKSYVKMGVLPCDNITRTDNEIICETPRQHGKESSKVVITVDILVGGVFINLKSVLYFHYHPDPVVRDVWPYKSFLGGGHNITITGFHFNSIYLNPNRSTFLVYMTTHDAKWLKKNGTCSIRNDTTMVCKMPSITSYQTVDAYIGLNLDGVMSYRNLSSSPKQFGVFRIYPKPIFKLRQSKKIVTSDQIFLVLKGSNLNTCCDKSDYNVFIGREKCQVEHLDGDSLSCAPPKLKMGIGENIPLPIRVDYLGLSTEVGFVEYVGSSSSMLGHGIMGAVIILLVIFLIAGGFVLFYRRKRLTPAQFRDSMAMLELSSDGNFEGQTRILDHIPSGYKAIIEDILVDRKNVQVHEEIGQGNFGMVFKGLWIDEADEENVVALKTLKGNPIKNKRKLEEFLQEATIMKGFKHENVLSLFGVAVDAKSLFVVFPYMANGDLRTFITNRQVQLTNFTGYILDVARGMEYLARKKFVHRDLAARNCMVDVFENVLIGDFGLARDIYQKDYYRPEKRKGALPYRWMAIESMEQGIFTSETDVWSFGVTMWEVFSAGIKPYAHVDNSYIQNYIRQGHRLCQPPACPNFMFSLMADCWREEPSSRPKFPDLVSELERFLQLGVESAVQGPDPSGAAANLPSQESSIDSSTWSSYDDEQLPDMSLTKKEFDVNRGPAVDSNVGSKENLARKCPSKSSLNPPGTSACSTEESCAAGPSPSPGNFLRPTMKGKSECGPSNVRSDSLQASGDVWKDFDRGMDDLIVKETPPAKVSSELSVKSRSTVQIEDYLQPV